MRSKEARDFDSLLLKLKDFKVNAGVQSTRGQCSLRDYNLLRIDDGFRNSLHLVSKNHDLGMRSIDFFKNINMNKGFVRSYSTLSRKKLFISYKCITHY